MSVHLVSLVHTLIFLNQTLICEMITNQADSFANEEILAMRFMNIILFAFKDVSPSLREVT